MTSASYIDLPLAADGTTTGSGFVSEHVQASATAGGSSGDPKPAEPLPPQALPALKAAGKLTAEIARKIAQAEKFLGGRNRRKRDDCK